MKSEQKTTCSTDSLCIHMQRMVDGNEQGKGLVAIHCFSAQAQKERLLGVAYKTSAKDKGLLLNVCPWCRGEPGYFQRRWS